MTACEWAGCDGTVGNNAICVRCMRFNANALQSPKYEKPHAHMPNRPDQGAQKADFKRYARSVRPASLTLGEARAFHDGYDAAFRRFNKEDEGDGTGIKLGWGKRGN